MTGLFDKLSTFVHKDKQHEQTQRSARSSGNSSSSAASKRLSDPPLPAQAPASAQYAQYAAFNPEPASRSEARGFVGANPAAVEPSFPPQAHIGPSVSPGLHGGSSTNHGAADTREQAEKLVHAERAAKSRMPKYEGLPAQFELLEKMGDGAFSNVYKAYDRHSKRKVAIKCVRKFELNHNQAGERHLGANMKKKPRATERANILKEVQIMRNLRHEGIVELLGFTESKDHYFLILELAEGGELFHQIVKLTYFSEDLARHVILQVAHGIRYLHEEKGVVHRDIKPENLLFDGIPIIPSRVSKARPYDEEKEDEGEFIPGVGGGGIGRVKIADFGLSKIVWNEETMTPCGTVGYTAPEIVKDERYSKSVDMWALGCVLYTLLCGFPPFYDESINVLTEKVARGYYTFLSPWWDDISASSKDLITHLLTVDPEKRYTIDEFLAHPWCNERPAGAPPAAAKLAPSAQQMPMDSPLLADAKGLNRAPRASPGVASLREAFDITYAVHRMEEEGARRRAYNGPGGAGARGFLTGLNEEDEEIEMDLEATKRKYGAGVAQAMEAHGYGKTNPNAKQQTAAQQQAAAAAYQGWGGADRKMAEAALYDGRAGTRDRGARQTGKRGGAFELSLDNATLLGRRHKPLEQSPLANTTLPTAAAMRA